MSEKYELPYDEKDEVNFPICLGGSKCARLVAHFIKQYDWPTSSKIFTFFHELSGICNAIDATTDLTIRRLALQQMKTRALQTIDSFKITDENERSHMRNLAIGKLKDCTRKLIRESQEARRIRIAADRKRGREQREYTRNNCN